MPDQPNPSKDTPTANHFDAAAATWDDKPQRREMARKVADAIVRRVGLRPEMDLLDLGCGTGLLGLALLSYVRSVTGADASEGMLDVLQSKIDEVGLGNMRTMLFDADRDEPPEDAFDVVTMNLVLHHLKDTGRALDACRRMLRPGGTVCIADLDTEPGTFHGNAAEHVYHHGFDRGALCMSLRDRGFSKATDETVHVIEKPDDAGALRKYPVFLITTVLDTSSQATRG